MADDTPKKGVFVPGQPRPYRRLQGFDYANQDVAYFVTVRAFGTTSPFTDNRLARLTIEALHWMRENRAVKIYAYVLMPDHLHVLLRLEGGQQRLGEVIGRFKSFTTTQSWSLGHRGQLWQARFYDHILRRSEQGITVAEYIRQNPVRRGLVADAELYPYSGLPDPM